MSETRGQNPFLFASGVPRSGTTLLQRMLDNHPELAVANDSHFIPRALEKTDKSLVVDARNGVAIPLTPELAKSVFEYHRFWRLGIDRTEFEQVRDDSETYQQLVAELYDLFARKSGKRLAGEKTPDYVRRLDLLHGLFPEAKLIHLVRDGRDVALSLLHWAKPDKGPGRIELWKNQPIAVCALWWRWMVTAAREQVAQIDPANYLAVHYERLVSSPSNTMENTCQFLDLDYSPRMVEFHRGKVRENRELSVKSAWLAPQTGLRNWRNQMPPEQIALFEALASDALQEHGYELSSERISGQVLTVASECQNWWDENFLAKQNECCVAGHQPVRDTAAQASCAQPVWEER